MTSALSLNQSIRRVLLSQSSFKPYPRYEQRRDWERLSMDLVAGEIEKAQAYVGFDWPTLPATLFMDFTRTGNRQNYERVCFQRRRALTALVIAECLEGKGRFMDDIVNGIWTICEESFWGVPAHNTDPWHGRDALPNVQRPIIDLFAAETGALIAWTYYLLSEPLNKISPQITARMVFEIKRRIVDPFIDRDDFWWMGITAARRLNNWTPWCISNCLSAILLTEPSAERRVLAVEKALRSLNRFLSEHPADGGCDEGPSYWNRAGGSLFDCLELLHVATEGHIDVFDDELVKRIGQYLYKVHISNDYFVNFADGSAKLAIDGALVFRYGRRINDRHLMALGAKAYKEKVGSRAPFGSLQRPLAVLFEHDEIVQHHGEPPFIQSSWLPDIQVLTCREHEGSDRGFFLAAKGGHNQESHNHNDVGQFIVYYNGEPVLIDVGVETYTAKTFSSDRYDIWTMQSGYHNLPTINGMGQKAGRRFEALNVNFSESQEVVGLSMDLDRAYPEEAGIDTWRRDVQLYIKSGGSVVLRDTFKLVRPTQHIQLSLMTPDRPIIDKDGVILSNKVKMVTSGVGLTTRVEAVAIEDPKLKSVWGNEIYRLLLTLEKEMGDGEWKITLTADRRQN